MATTEIQGMLARLLATENLIVEHRQVSTASFDIDGRVLTLPIWDNVPAYVYDMLVAHEVGHALFTELRDWKREDKYRKVPGDYVNVVEDARIEKLMKKRYPGMNRDFFKGYRYLNDKDFFEISQKDVNQLSFIDRVNLYFKVGTFYDIDFNDRENELVTSISNAETFEEVLDLSLACYLLSKEQQQESTPMPQPPQNSAPGDGETTMDQSPEDEQEPGDSDAFSDVESEEYDDDDTEACNDGNVEENDDESATQKAYDKNLEDLRNQHAKRPVYVTMPDVVLENVIVPVDKIKAHVEDHFGRVLAQKYSDREDVIQQWNEQKRTEFKQFKTSAQRDVNLLVKEFEMRKSADAYARTTVSRTGVLDTGKLHSYKYNEDVFRKVATTTDGKNHSLLFVLDWSGSMADEMLPTIKQLFQLVWFCRKVNIPFEVYAFTNEAWKMQEDYESRKPVKEWKLHDIKIQDTFRLMNLISSNMKTKDFEDQLLNVWKVVHTLRNMLSPLGMELSGTPINESLVCMNQIVKKFQQQTKTQKCNVVYLTDGEGNELGYNVIRMGYDDRERKCHIPVRHNTVIRHKSKTFNIDGMGPSVTDALVRAIKRDNNNCNIVSFRILHGSEMSNFYRWYATDSYENYDQMRSELKKHGSVSFTSNGFDKWFGIPNRNLCEDDTLDVTSSEKKDVSKAFRKMFKNKKSNKYITKQFVEMVA
tara:strand:- start:44805 stop:46916 length:2112 start_codon:yes stop_codon:yes gene_type:complete